VVVADDNGTPIHWNQTDLGMFMKHMDSSFESFFYQRSYNERNFTFYLQVLAAQYKSDDALIAFRRMEAMNIMPTDHTYNQLMLCFAKKGDIQTVLKLNQEAIDKYGI
jgi:pentatricopeptide repeat protein